LTIAHPTIYKIKIQFPMNLRKKIILLVSIILSSLITVLSLSLSQILLQSFSDLEEKNTNENVKRVSKAIQEELNKLSVTASDWAGWDDTYTFVQDGNKTYIEKNLADTTFENIDINFLLFYNNKKEQVLGLTYDLETSQFIELPTDLEIYINPQSPLLSHNTNNSDIQGFLSLKEGLLMVVSKPILTSERTGPIMGSLIMGRLINETRIKAFEQRTQLSLNLHTKVNILSSDLKSILVSLEGKDNTDDILVKPLNQDIINGYSLIKDINEQVIILLEVKLNRDIYKQGKISLYSLITSLILVGLIFELVMIFFLEKLILSRLTNLNKDVEKIGKTNDYTLKVNVTKEKDELTNFAITLNWMLDKLHKEREKTEKLLLNVLPESIANQLKKDNQVIAEDFEKVTILFADIVGFTSWSSTLHPLEVVKFLNHIFSDFDYLAEQLGLEKIKTIGDAYMVAAGLPLPREDHAQAIAEMALAMQVIMDKFSLTYQHKLQMRIGINTGVVVAGVIGTKKFVYDLWGDAVNIASRMESLGEAGKIQVTQSTYQLLYNQYIFQKRGAIDVKGKGRMETYWLEGKINKFLTEVEE
jgi:adenylate cyclase